MLASGVGRRIALAFAEAGATPSSLRSSDDGGRPVPIHFGMDSAAKRQAATRLQPARRAAMVAGGLWRSDTVGITGCSRYLPCHRGQCGTNVASRS